jgi:hypothetical protein
MIPTDLICYQSPVFKAAFEGQFLEGRTLTMTLDDVDSKLFGLLVHWFYTEDVFIKDLEVVNNKTISQECLDKNSILLANLWLLADRFLIPLLQNNIMDVLLSSNWSSTSEGVFDLVLYIYESTEHGSPCEIKKFTTFLLSEVVDRKIIRAWKDPLPRELLLDFSIALCIGPDNSNSKFFNIYVDEDGTGKKTIGHHGLRQDSSSR